MKKIYAVILSGLLFASCSPSKKLQPANTAIDTRPAATTKPTVTEKPVNTGPLDANMASITGKWKFELSSEKDFGKMGMSAMPELSFNETNRKVSGSTGCNIFNGFFFTSGNQFNFSPLAIDKKNCTDPTVEKYIKYFFRSVGFYKTEGSKLYLYNKEDKSRYVVFARK